MPREPVTLELEEPVNAYGEMVKSLTLKSPIGSDILACGYPFSTERNPRSGTVTDAINVPAARLLLSKMAQVPEGTIDQLTALDFFKAVEIVKFFFLFSFKKAPPDSAGAPLSGQAAGEPSLA